MIIQELPMPAVSAGMVLVQNHYSLISAGTEGATVKTARKGLIGKAKERPQQVKQVLDVLKKQGPVQTYRAVMKKLDAYSPLGYSSAGVVIEVGEGVRDFTVGDKVACAGVGYANHAEVVSVPVNLCVKLPESADLKLAAYNTLGAIALQGIRQADLRLGETCAVIGLGLIGQLTCLMLRASGVRVVGVDIDPAIVEIAGKRCTELVLERYDPGITDSIERFTGGFGADAVIITAGSSSLDPVNFAGEIARKKGRVVVVGAVPTGFDRDPHYYRKELDLRMSCSYGPGRYDLEYEEKGIDYPAAYVRWTEKRNMEAFQELVHSRRIDIDYLTTHEASLEQAPQAYDMIVNRSEPFLGILIKYNVGKPIDRKRVELRSSAPVGTVGIAFIGAGSYAQGNLLPNLPKNDPNIVCRGVMTSSGTTSKRVAERYGFEFCTSNENDILINEDINSVFIATRHDTHARFVLGALKAGKHVFVEKPLCLNEKEQAEIREAYLAADRQDGVRTHVMVGFNRRFSPLTVLLKKKIGKGPMAMMCRVNAGLIPADSWIQDREIGGGRIVGEVCHFVDYLTFLNDSLPVAVSAAALPDPAGCEDTVTINLQFQNGSIGTIAYFANGSKDLFKEYVEVCRGGVTAVLKDFKELNIYGNGRPYSKKLFSQDKGQREMVKAFVEAVRDGGITPIPFEDIYAVTITTFKILESLRTGKIVRLDK